MIPGGKFHIFDRCRFLISVSLEVADTFAVDQHKGAQFPKASVDSAVECDIVSSGFICLESVIDPFAALTHTRTFAAEKFFFTYRMRFPLTHHFVISLTVSAGIILIGIKFTGDGLDFAVRFALAHIHDDREDIRMRHIAPFILNSGDEETGISVKNRLFADTSQSGPDRISIVLFINFEIKLCFGTVFEIDEIPIIKEIDVFDF